MKFSAIITAGGTSTRFGNTNKLLEKINGKEVIKYTIETFLKTNIDEIVICANSSIIPILKEFYASEAKVKIVKGGQSRQESVYNGLKSTVCDFVLIHDGARPLITKEIIENTIKSVIKNYAVSVMTKTIDTIKEVNEDGKIIKTIDRTKLYNTQTPQAFEYNLIRNTHEKLINENYTDDAGMVESLGFDVYMVEGDYKNIKITTQNDIHLAETYLNNK